MLTTTKRFVISASFCILTLFMLPSYAVDNEFMQQVDSAKTMMSNAMDYYQENGLKATIKAIDDNNTVFINSEKLFTTLLDTKGVILAHPVKPYLRNVSLTERNYKDTSGKLLMKKINQAVKQGGGWVHYYYREAARKSYDNTDKKFIKSRMLYVQPVKGTDLIFAVGFITDKIH